MYNSKEIIVNDNGLSRVQCKYIGTSFNNEKYLHEEILHIYKYTEDNFSGYNEEDNIILISGVLPPLNAIKQIQKELDDRNKERPQSIDDFSKFTIKGNNHNKFQNSNDIKNTSQVSSEKTKDNKNNGKKMKKTLKKNLYDIL
jgi:hypothetical protein